MTVFVVYGPPCSGKSTFAKDNMSDEDILYDYDKLIKATSTREYHEIEKGASHDLVMSFRRRFCEKIRDLPASSNAYLLTRWPSDYLMGLLADYQKEVVPMNTSLDECLDRLKADDDRPDKVGWEEIIREWFNEHDYNYGAAIDDPTSHAKEAKKCTM